VGPYSNSRLSAYENCPRQYEYRYVQKIPVETESIEAFVGKRVHEILERLYHHIGRWGRPPSLRQVLDRFEKDWPIHWSDRVEIIKSEQSTDDYKRLGARCLENYYRGFYPFDQAETIGIEEPVTLALDPDARYQVRGIVDRIARPRPGEYEIHDYKTGAWLPPQRRVDQDRQLALYQIALQQSRPDVESVELVWHYLAFGKTLRSTRTPEAIEGLKRETIELIDTIERAAEFRATPGPLCRWCEYRTRCPEGQRTAASREDPPIPGDGDAPPFAAGEPAALVAPAIAAAPAASVRGVVAPAQQLPLL
jgi:putative RecB family exonuclease